MRQWLGKVLLAATGVIFALMLCEAGLRLAGVEYPFFYDYDPLIGVKLRPGMQGYYLKEGGGYVSINRDGWRDREHALEKPRNTLRIAVLGDSFTEAMQVNREETFCAILERELQECQSLQGRTVEVLNFGVSGLGTTQELLILKHKVWKYSPDVVLLAFTTGNDVTDNSRQLKGIDHHPYHIYRGNFLELDDKQAKKTSLAKQNSLFRRAVFYFRIDRLRIMQVAYQFKEFFWEWWSVHNIGGKAHASARGCEAGISDLIYREPATAAWQAAWRVTEGLLLLMRDEVVHRGSRFYVVTLTNGVQVDPDSVRRRGFEKTLGVPDLFYPERRLASFCQGHGIPILLLAPRFQEYATQHQVFLHGFGKNLGTGHWNQEGHRLAGKTIAAWLCPRLK